MAVDSVISNVASQIRGAIQKAAQSTGISFNYLLTTAKIESSLNPSAQASTSSATGLYQFIEQTWLGTVKQDGPALGLGQYASAISKNSDGRYTVADPDMRTAIMKLRTDPATSAMMAGAFSRNNANQLTGTIGRQPTEGELYVAHFLGPDGAGKLINATMRNENANAAAMFPSAAGANRSIFYHRDGTAKTVGEVYTRLTSKFDNSRTVAVASAKPVSSGIAAAAAAHSSGAPAVPQAAIAGLIPMPAARPITIAGLSPAVALPGENDQPLAANDFLSAFPVAAKAPIQMAAANVPDTAGITQAYAAARDAQPGLTDTRPLFRAMFTDVPRAGVNQTVAGLWSPSDASAADNEGTGLSAPGLPVRTLDLFTDSATNVRRIFNGKA